MNASINLSQYDYDYTHINIYIQVLLEEINTMNLDALPKNPRTLVIEYTEFLCRLCINDIDDNSLQ